MNLLGAVLYDPAAAVSKSTATLLAMTAFDTTNLRLTVTVPAHGMLLIKLRCPMVGYGTTSPMVLLGCLNGATVVGRVNPQYGGIEDSGGAAGGNNLVAEYVATGLTPGSITLDAAYGVEFVNAGTNIKYGGPNNTTTVDAWGAFQFEIWDPQPIPIAAPGATGGLHINGTNAGTTTFGALTVTGTLTISDGIVVTRSTGNSSGVSFTGSGTGHGLIATSGTGATGDGIRATAASTNGNGFNGFGTGTADGIQGTGGSTGRGFHGVGGASSGAGFRLEGTAGNSPALELVGQGSAAGLKSTGGATGHGALFTGGATSGDGFNMSAGASGHGFSSTGVGTTKHGMTLTGGATTSSGLVATGGGVGHGAVFTSGAGATGDGVRMWAASTNGQGLSAFGTGAANGILAFSGLTGYGLLCQGGNSSGAAGRFESVAGNSAGLEIAGRGTEPGLKSTGGSTGHGIQATSGTGATGDGFRINAASTNGNGLSVIGTGTGNGFLVMGGSTTNTPAMSVITTSADGSGISLSSAGTGLGLLSTNGDLTTGINITSGVKKNKALANFQFMMTDSTTHLPAPGKTVTVTRSINNAAYAAGTLSAVTENPSANGMYAVDFAAADLNGGVIVLKASAAGCDDTYERIITQP